MLKVRLINTHTYPENENGQTYGSKEEATTDEMLLDLIHAVSVHGIAGYVLKKNYLEELGRDVPLYDVDGETVIGVFHIGGK